MLNLFQHPLPERGIAGQARNDEFRKKFLKAARKGGFFDWVVCLLPLLPFVSNERGMVKRF